MIFGDNQSDKYIGMVYDYSKNQIISQYFWEDDNGKILDVAKSSEKTGAFLSKYGVGRGSSFEIL